MQLENERALNIGDGYVMDIVMWMTEIALFIQLYSPFLVEKQEIHTHTHTHRPTYTHTEHFAINNTILHEYA